LSRRGLNPIKSVYDPDRPDGRLNLTASAFNQLGQYSSSTGMKGRAANTGKLLVPGLWLVFVECIGAVDVIRAKLGNVLQKQDMHTVYGKKMQTRMPSHS